MIIDITREMNDKEYEEYLNLQKRYDKKYDYLEWYEEYFSEDKEYYDYPEHDKKMIDLTTKEEDIYIEDLDARTSLCADEFKYQRNWYVENNLSDYNIVLWLEKEKIIDYFLIYEVIYNAFWLCLKYENDFRLFQTRWTDRFDEIFLIENGWFEQKMGPEEQLKWAQENLGNDFLYDYKNDIGYFRNGTEAALKLRWYE